MRDERWEMGRGEKEKGGQQKEKEAKKGGEGSVRSAAPRTRTHQAPGAFLPIFRDAWPMGHGWPMAGPMAHGIPMAHGYTAYPMAHGS